MITERQVFNGIAIGVGLHLLTYVGLRQWVPHAFIFWYTFLIDWRKENE